MENFIIYKPLNLFGKNDNNEENIDNKNKNKSIKEENNSMLFYFMKIIFILFILFAIIMILLFLYKSIRRYQINKIINDLTKNNEEKSNNHYKLHRDNINLNKMKENNFDSKISYMIENL